MHSTHDEVDLRLRVGRRTTGAEGVVVLELRDPAGGHLPAWSAGAHVDLRLPGGLTRQYSLCGDARDRSVWRIAVLREPGGRGGSAHVHDALVEGSEVDVRGPRNHFPLVPAPRYVFVAGGIGITPILPMIDAADAAGAEWELHYGGRSRRSMAFLEALEDATGTRVTLHPQDEVGLIDLDTLLADPRPGTLVYCCGPEPLLTAVEQHCQQWPEGALHLERFAPKDVGEPVLTGAFEVELAVSGLALTVPPEKSVLEVVEEAGVGVLSSCQEGTCGTCETTVLSGEVDHRDSLLTPAEQAANDTMFICVSRAACPKLVLEL
ncbi:PDR/VanB family oxidoreductase [Blastococcus montanus]|uniref:PDR/VanB family oxidoreductase n=1 Tax=Blastococcus montanus TaxID=3144973 RepID=UPI003208D4E0